MPPQRLGGLLIAIGYSVLLFEALRTGIAWWNGELEELGVEEILVLLALPVLAWVGWRFLYVPSRRRRAATPLERGPHPPPE